MTTTHAVTTLLLEADATYSWLLPDGTILPVSTVGGKRHEEVAKEYYIDRFSKPLKGGTYENWAKAQGWARLVGTGFEAGKLTKQLLRRVQQTYLDAGVREMGTSFFIDISGPGGRDMQVFELPYRDFLDIINPGELRRYRFESRMATLESKGQVHRLFGEGLDDDIIAAKRQFLTYLSSAEENAAMDTTGSRLYMRYYVLLARVGQVRMEEGEPDPTDWVNTLAQVLAEVYRQQNPELDPDLSPVENFIDPALTLLSKSTDRTMYLAGDNEERAEILNKYAGQVYRWDPNRYREVGPPEHGDTIDHGDLEQIDMSEATPNDFVMPEVMGVGDYSGGSTLQRANFLAFMGSYEGEPGVHEVTSGHDYRGVAIRLSVDNEDIWEVLDGLTDYPVVDEEVLSQYEWDLSVEGWETWGQDDYVRELQKREDLEHIDLEAMAQSGRLWTIFDSVADTAGIYWNPDGNRMYIDVESVADATAARDFEEEAAELRRDQEVAAGQQFMAFNR